MASLTGVDLLCINQEDAEERGRQVARMTDIYALAPRVVVWLGKPSSGGKETLETLAHEGSKKVAATKLAALAKPPTPKLPSGTVYIPPPPGLPIHHAMPGRLQPPINPVMHGRPRALRSGRSSASIAGSITSTLVIAAGRKMLNTLDKPDSVKAGPSPSTNLLASSTGWRTLQGLFDRDYF